MANQQAILAFIHIYKAAGTTFTGILRRNFGMRHFDSRLLNSKAPLNAAQLRRIALLYPGLRSLAGHGIRPFTDLRDGHPNIEFCTFLREPVARLISAFQFSCINRVKDHGWSPSWSDLERYFERNLDFHVGGLRSALAKDGDLENAMTALRDQIGFVGLVEAYDDSLAVLHHWAKTKGIFLDVRYRRSNVSEQRGQQMRDATKIESDGRRISEFVAELKTSNGVLHRLRSLTSEDLALYRAGQQKFEAMKARFPLAANASTEIEDSSLSEDKMLARGYRGLVGRPLVPLLTRGV